MSRMTSKLSYAKVMATAAAFVVLGGGSVAVATSGGDRGPTAEIAKKKSDRQVVTYQGTTEDGGTVGFRITRKRMVVGFTMLKR